MGVVSVGELQAQRASIDDRKVILGQASVRDDVVRGFLQAENWQGVTWQGKLQLSPDMYLSAAVRLNFRSCRTRR